MSLASARQHSENQKENQAGHSSGHAVEGQSTKQLLKQQFPTKRPSGSGASAVVRRRGATPNAGAGTAGVAGVVANAADVAGATAHATAHSGRVARTSKQIQQTNKKRGNSAFYVTAKPRGPSTTRRGPWGTGSGGGERRHPEEEFRRLWIISTTPRKRINFRASAQFL